MRYKASKFGRIFREFITAKTRSRLKICCLKYICTDCYVIYMLR